MNKDVVIAGCIVAACLALVILAFCLPRVKPVETEHSTKCEYSVKSSGNVYVIIDNKCNVTHTLVFNPDTKEVNISLGVKKDD